MTARPRWYACSVFDAAVYARRRDALMKAIGPNAVLMVKSLPERLRNGDALVPFRQHSDVFYLTGFVEPDTTLVLRPGAETERFVMFVRPRDRDMEIWDGKRAGVEGAKETYGADAAYPAAELPSKLWELIANTDELHHSLGLDRELDGLLGDALVRLRKWERKGKRPPRAVVDPRFALHELRLRKEPVELAALRTASKITADAHIAAMRMGRPGSNEHDLAAVIDYTFRKSGGIGPGYTSIVGAGDNATILHYIENDKPIGNSDLVLVDAGCEYEHYTADITRTWPANGTFSAAQKRVYEVVLATQKAAIEMTVPGVSIDDIHNACVRSLTQGMLDLGLLKGTVDERIADLSYKKFYMHGTSHWLGLDVHDAGAYTTNGVPRPLEANMVITIEPGLYISRDAQDVPDEYRGIGVRIEDDVAVTATGNEVLTAACPKEIAELEAICDAPRGG